LPDRSEAGATGRPDSVRQKESASPYDFAWEGGASLDGADSFLKNMEIRGTARSACRDGQRIPLYCAYMGTVIASSALDGFLEPLSRCLDTESARRVVDLRVDPAIQARVEVLAERANDGALTEEERAEYAALVDAADLISILKLRVRRRLQANGS
jgi:hypothetical protein